MSTNDKDQISSDSAIELDEDELNHATGGAQATTTASRYNFFEAWPSKWKVNGFDGKGTDLSTDTASVKKPGKG